MGNSASSLPSGIPDVALHVLRVVDGSPGADASLEPFFDYIIGVSTSESDFVNLSDSAPPSRPTSADPFSRESPIPAAADPAGPRRSGAGGLRPPATSNGDHGEGEEEGLNVRDLAGVLERNEGKRIGLKVYNAKSQRLRDVYLIPRRTWGGSSSAGADAPGAAGSSRPSLLGVSLRACTPSHALESVYHVLDVLEGSPAEMAGLVPWGDYVLAWSGGPLHSESDFYRLIEAHVDKPLRLFVYNSDLDNLREVVLYPTRQWGGEGLIGCGIGYGLLHRIPRPASPEQGYPAESPGRPVGVPAR